MNKSTELVPVAMRDRDAAYRLSRQYAKVNGSWRNALEQTVRFGAMLKEWGDFLGEGRGGAGGGASGGLQTWLAKNCPEINYQTAMGYKHLAEKAVRMLGGGAPAVAALIGRDTVTDPDGNEIPIDAEVVEKKDEIFRAADSRRKLEQMYFDFTEAPGRRGRKKGEKHAPAKVSTPMDDARTLFARLVVCAGMAGLFESIALWNVEMLQAADRALSPILAEVKKRLADIR